MNKEYVMRVAQTIKEQLVTMTSIEILMSWGMEKLIPTVFKGMTGVKFHVNGRLFQGDVLICLNGSDYYEVYLQDDTRVECINDEVCFDALGSVIDCAIESGKDKAEYDKFCEQEWQKLLKIIV